MKYTDVVEGLKAIRVVHNVVRLVLGEFFAPHLQGRFPLILNYTSPVEGWEHVYIRCGAPYRFNVVSLVKKKQSKYSKNKTQNHMKQPR